MKAYLPLSYKSDRGKFLVKTQKEDTLVTAGWMEMPLEGVALSFISHSILEAGRTPRDGLVQDFSIPELLTFQAGKFFVVGDCPVHYRMFNSILSLPTRCQRNPQLWQPIMFRAMSPQLRTTAVTQSSHFLHEVPDSQMQRGELVNHTPTTTNQISELFQQNQAARVFFWFNYTSEW